MILHRTGAYSLMFGTVAALLVASPAAANVNLEFRPATQTVNNGTTVNVEIYAVSDNAGNQDVGLVRTVFTWDHTKLQLSGRLLNGPYAWQSATFPNDSTGDGLNAPFGSVPGNDGDAMFFALAQFSPNPPAMATPSGLLVATLQFTAIDTGVDVPVALESVIGSTETLVRDAPIGGVDVTGTIGPPVAVTIICDNNPECDDGNDCTTDVCTAQVCSHTPVASGSACGDPSNTECDNPDTCDASGNCLANLEPMGTSCGSAANSECDNPDTCNGSGTCLSNFEPSGFACGSAANTECDNPDTCNGTGTCLANFEGAGTACGDPTDVECNGADTCNGSGTCQDNFDPVGAQCGSQANTACSDPDSCDGNGFCLENNHFCLPETPFCIDDGDGMPLCVECVFGDNTPCEDQNMCTSDFCTLGNTCLNSPDPLDGTPCPDGLFCNGAEVCDGGVCVALEPACDDSNVCTDDLCDEGADQCNFVPDNSNDPDDGLFCNGTDTCVNGKIVPGTPPVCDDGDECTTGSCNEANDNCDQTPNMEPCDDGDACTFGDVCGGGSCQSGNPPNGSGLVNLQWTPLMSTVMVNDQVLIGLEACAPGANDVEVFSIDVVLNWDPAVLSNPVVVNNGPYNWLSSSFPNDAPQDNLNGTFADGDAKYTALSQLGMPAMVPASGCLLVTSFQFDAVNLSPGSLLEIILCTGDSPTVTRVDAGVQGNVLGTIGNATVKVVECFTAGDCSNGVFCDGAEQCQSNSCVFGPAPCDDGNICTSDVCFEGAQSCDHNPLTGDFDQDGLFCTGIDRCEDGTFVPGSPPDCDDENICTDDSCDEVFDQCAHDANNLACNDGNPCTFSDMCSQSMCSGTVDPDCVPCQVNADCDDGIDCTVDTCSPSDTCDFTPSDALCPQDGLFCNGVEYCDPPIGDPQTGCASPGPPCPNCDEATGCPCDPPLVEAFGSKFLRVTPQPFDSQIPMAIVVTCAGGTSRYAAPMPQQSEPLPYDTQADGEIDGSLVRTLTNPGSALFRTPAQWLGDVYVTGETIIPSTEYSIQVDCGEPGMPNLTTPVMATTWAWGDVFNEPPVSLADVFAVIQAFQGNFQVAEGKITKPQVDLDFCLPNNSINVADAFRAVQAFQGSTYQDAYAETNCPLSCQ